MYASWCAAGPPEDRLGERHPLRVLMIEEGTKHRGVEVEAVWHPARVSMRARHASHDNV